MAEAANAYRASPKREDEEMTGYTIRLIREEVRHNTLLEAEALAQLHGAHATAREFRKWREGNREVTAK